MSQLHSQNCHLWSLCHTFLVLTFFFTDLPLSILNSPMELMAGSVAEILSFEAFI